jgi:hypothetical protein
LLLVCSNWFADDLWALVGLPDAWLPPFYQAVLAPVRGLWHIWPQYKSFYVHVEETYGLAASYPDLFGLASILVQAVAAMAGDAARQAAPTCLAALGMAMPMAACYYSSSAQGAKREYEQLGIGDSQWGRPRCYKEGREMELPLQMLPVCCHSLATFSLLNT